MGNSQGSQDYEFTGYAQNILRVVPGIRLPLLSFPGGEIFSHDIQEDLFAFRWKGFFLDLQLRDQVDKGIDPPLKLKKFIEHHNLLVFKDTKTALKAAPFIPNNIAGLSNQFLNFIQGRLRVLHGAKIIEWGKWVMSDE